MNEIQRYLAEEVGVDYADGSISRREAIRRLALLGVGGGAALAILAACAEGSPGPSATAGPGGSPVTPVDPSAPAGPAPAATEPVTFPSAAGRSVQGAYGAPVGPPRGSVLVVHENRGLTDHIRSVAGRLAASGFPALAVDLLSEEGGTASFPDPARATAALNAAPPQRFVEDMKAAIDELKRRAPALKVGAVGFCFGGAMVWNLLAAGDDRLFAAAPFYGPAPSGADLSSSPNAAVLAVYAELDSRVNASIEGARAAMQRAGLVHEVVVYPGVDHAFFNDTGSRYDAAAAATAYQRLVAWFTQHLA